METGTVDSLLKTWRHSADACGMEYLFGKPPPELIPDVKGVGPGDEVSLWVNGKGYVCVTVIERNGDSWEGIVVLVTDFDRDPPFHKGDHPVYFQTENVFNVRRDSRYGAA